MRKIETEFDQTTGRAGPITTTTSNTTPAISTGTKWIIGAVVVFALLVLIF